MQGKNVNKGIALVLSICFLIGGIRFGVGDNNVIAEEVAVMSSDEITADMNFRGVWISTVYNSDFPTVQNDIDGQKLEFTTKLDQLKELGINAVMVQVRPKGDAYYKSELNPWSSTITGTEGKDPGYDVMEFMIDEAHKRGMEFHAWLNPYRVTTSGTDVSKLSSDNMARKNPSWIITYNNALYYNPELTEVKQYITDTVEEIVVNYNVDGVHFDDYFYPSKYPLSEGETDDGAEANARRGHVNEMVKMVYDIIKSVDENIDFGISPMGIWKNDYTDPKGSATNGSEAYYTVSSDALAWIEGGYIDYITPQIYWETGNIYADYETLVKWWKQQVVGTDVELYIGQGVYKDVVAEQIGKQLDINNNYNVDGSIYFSMRDLLSDREGCGTAIKNHYISPTVSSNIDPVIKEPTVTEPTVTEPEQTVTPSVETPVIEEKLAKVNKLPVFVNGNEVEFKTYSIDDNTYFKLRDIATAVNGTIKQFDTLWDGDAFVIKLLKNTPYSGTEEESEEIQEAKATTSRAGLLIDDKEAILTAFTINGYTYYKLRDIGEALDFGVIWNSEERCIEIDTSIGYSE